MAKASVYNAILHRNKKAKKKIRGQMSFGPENWTVSGVHDYWTVYGHLQKTLFNFWMFKGEIIL